MAYDPTKPVDDSPLDAAEMRGQLTALKALIDGLQAQIVALQTLVNQKASLDDMNQAVAANSARNVDGFVFSGDDVSDPPQKVEVEDIQSQLSSLVQALRH